MVPNALPANSDLYNTKYTKCYVICSSCFPAWKGSSSQSSECATYSFHWLVYLDEMPVLIGVASRRASWLRNLEDTVNGIWPALSQVSHCRRRLRESRREWSQSYQPVSKCNQSKQCNCGRQRQRNGAVRTLPVRSLLGGPLGFWEGLQSRS